MAIDLGVRYLHFLSVFTLVAVVLMQRVLIRPEVARWEVVRLQKVDLVYAISAVTTLLTGLAQWLWVGKPAAYYGSNPVFHTKFTLFLIVGLLSIWPSVFFGKQRKGEPGDVVKVPSGVVWSIQAELILLAAMPLLASLMARGIGIRG